MMISEIDRQTREEEAKNIKLFPLLNEMIENLNPVPVKDFLLPNYYGDTNRKEIIDTGYLFECTGNWDLIYDQRRQYFYAASKNSAQSTIFAGIQYTYNHYLSHKHEFKTN